MMRCAKRLRSLKRNLVHLFHCGFSRGNFLRNLLAIDKFHGNDDEIFIEFKRQRPDNLWVIEIGSHLNVFDELVMHRDGTIELAAKDFKEKGLTLGGMD